MKIANNITLPVKIENGKFKSNTYRISEILDCYNGHTINITFSKRTNKRSNKQNSYYWGVVIPIFLNCIKVEWGEIWSIQDMHDFLKTNCNFKELVNEETGAILRKPKSTTENNTVEQEEFNKKCRILAKEYFNTNIPLPNEQITIK